MSSKLPYLVIQAAAVPLAVVAADRAVGQGRGAADGQPAAAELAELPGIVQSDERSATNIVQPAAVDFSRVSGDGAVGDVSRALLYRPPPSVAGRAAGDGEARERRRTPGSRSNTRLSSPPLTVNPAGVPVIVSVPPCRSARAGPASDEIVCAVAKTDGSKVIVSAGVEDIRQVDGLRRSGRRRARPGRRRSDVDHQPGLNLEGADVGGESSDWPRWSL